MEREQERSTGTAKSSHNQQSAEQDPSEQRGDMAHPSKPNEKLAGDATLVRRSVVSGTSSRPRPQPSGAPVTPNAFPASSASAGEPPTPPLSPESERSAMV